MKNFKKGMFFSIINWLVCTARRVPKTKKKAEEINTISSLGCVPISKKQFLYFEYSTIIRYNLRKDIKRVSFSGSQAESFFEVLSTRVEIIKKELSLFFLVRAIAKSKSNLTTTITSYSIIDNVKSQDIICNNLVFGNDSIYENLISGLISLKNSVSITATIQSAITLAVIHNSS